MPGTVIMCYPVVTGLIPPYSFVARFERGVNIDTVHEMCTDVAIRGPLLVALPSYLDKLVLALRIHGVSLPHSSRNLCAITELIQKHNCNKSCERFVLLFSIQVDPPSNLRMPLYLMVMPQMKMPF